MDDQIYLVPDGPVQPGADRGLHPARPVQARRRALTVLLALVAVAVGVQHARAGGAQRPVAQPARPPVQVASGDQRMPWPQGAGVCGSQLELPQVSTDLSRIRTHTTVLVGGDLPAVVSVDSGRRSDIAGLRLRSDQYVSKAVRAGSANYLLVRSCRRRWVATVIRAQAGQPQQVVSGARAVFGLLDAGRGGVWAEAYSGPIRVNPEAALGTTLVRLDRPGPAIDLPIALNVIGMHGDQVVASVFGTADAAIRAALYRYDLSTRRSSLLGMAYSATESGGRAFWTSTPCSATGPCTLHSYDLDTGVSSVRDYHLPLGTGIAGGLLSPDRRKLVFALQRETPDRIYRSSAPENPSDLVVLDLVSGVLEPVPGIELPPGAAPSSLSFSADSSWLIVSLVQDGWIDVYSWRSGLGRPQLTPRPPPISWSAILAMQLSQQLGQE